jgi:hypothetical protein
MNADREKFVNFRLYCPKCEHYEVAQDAEPCNECLHYPTNVESEKPVKYKEKEKK